MVALITRIVIAIMTLSLMSSGNYHADYTADYFKRLNSIDVYENSTVTAFGAKNVHDIIENHFKAPLPEGKTEKKAIFIGYDGVRADTFCKLDTHEQSAINAVLNDGGHAYLSYAGGIRYPYYNIQATDSAPGWTSMLTGELYYKTGVLWNGYDKNENYPTLIKSLIDDKLADMTSCYSAWGSYLKETLGQEAESCAAAGYNANYINAADFADTSEGIEEYLAVDKAVTDLAVADIKSENCSDFIFALYESTDECGHANSYHPDNEKYMAAFAYEDALAQQLVDSIKERPTYATEDWLIIMSTDHGAFNHSHGYGTAMERFTYVVTTKDLSKCILF